MTATIKWRLATLLSRPTFQINISREFLIGYISSLSTDSNNLTKSGTITPAVDFEHIEEVLVILDKKQSAGE